MITYSDLSQALFEFWSMLEIPVYKTGHVDDDAAFPYLTFEVAYGGYSKQTPLFAFLWFQQKSGQNVNADRAEMCDKIEKMIPEEGVAFQTPSGMLWILRNERQFISDYGSNEKGGKEEAGGEPIVGARISYVVKAY